jgi:hypothetical protein
MAISTANSHKERKNRAEQRNRGDRPCGPDWETAHADARPLTVTVSFLVLKASTTCPGSLTLTDLGRQPFRGWPVAFAAHARWDEIDLGNVAPAIELTKELIGTHLG